MLYIRGLIFTILVPVVVAVVVPSLLHRDIHAAIGLKMTGGLVILIGAALYGMCLLRFLISGGTPAIFFTRHLKFLIGEEPAKLVREGIYRFSRNPMYLSVLLVVFGQAISLNLRKLRSMELLCSFSFTSWSSLSKNRISGANAAQLMKSMSSEYRVGCGGLGNPPGRGNGSIRNHYGASANCALSNSPR
jgi:protein-S-isoprenylcysteine O-methyltransferase Ste14